MLKPLGRLFIVSGPSGVGKGTLCRRVAADDAGIEISVSMTTRPPRPGDEEGITYYFTTRERFMKEAAEGSLMEYAEVYGHYYGTPKANVIEKLEQGIDVILEVDVQGALSVKRAYPKGILIFILPPSMAELRKRLTGRGSETEEAVKLRLSKALEEISCMNHYDYCVVNGELEEAADRVKAIVTAERSRVPERIDAIFENDE